MNAISFIHQFGIFSREGKVRKASREEVKRWIVGGAVLINGEKLSITELIDFPIFSLVIFPNGRRVTLK